MLERRDQLKNMVSNAVMVEAGRNAVDVANQWIGLDGVQPARGGARLA
jgi:hypothetical protein